MKKSIDIKALLILTTTFVIFAAVGTVSHEYGHILVAEFLGYETTLFYDSMTYYNEELVEKREKIYSEYKNEIEGNTDFEKKEEYRRLTKKLISNGFWITLGGPIQTIFTGLIGLIVLILRKNRYKEFGLKWIDWLAVFLSLFWLREVFNLAMSIAFELISPDGSFFSGDEVYISRGLGLWEGTIPLLLGALGILVSAYVIFRIIPQQIRLTFFVSGLLGGGLGFVLWVDILGPILLP
jgi:hypothetical protein